MGPVSDNPPMDSMASPNRDDTLEKGMTLTFGSWTCIPDGLAGFISHLDDCQAVEPFSTSQPNNSVAPAAGVENPPEDSQEGENSDLVNRYWTDPDTPLASYDYNLDSATTGDQLSSKIAKCINLVRSTLEHSGREYVTAPTVHYQPEHVTGYLDRVDDSILDCISIDQDTLGKKLCPKHRRSHYSLSDDLLGQVNRVDETLLECIKPGSKHSECQG